MGPRPGLIPRALAHLHSWSIDRRLLAGEGPGESEETAARLEQLLAPGYRARLASGLRRLTDVARVPWTRWSPSIPVRRSEVLASEPQIRTLADELEQIEDANPRGIILASRLLHDGRSPVYWRRSEVELERAVKHARAALHLR